MTKARRTSSGKSDGGHELIVVGGREISISNPDKVLFPGPRHTKLDLVRYYLAVADGALRGAGGRPNMLVRYPNGIERRVLLPEARPDLAAALDRDRVAPVPLRPERGRGRAARRRPRWPGSPTSPAWSCIPHPVRAEDLDHPDELRVDLDPVPGVEWDQVRQVAQVVQARSADLGLTGWPKTSGSRGMHVIVRIERRWSFDEVRRAALALAREVERRAPKLATSKWWKEERHGVFVDYNQNAKDRTVASAYSVRPKPDARVSAPLTWDELDELPARGLYPGHHAEAVRRGRRSARRHRRPRRVTRRLARALGAARARRVGRRALAAALPQAARRAQAGAAVQGPRREASADRDRSTRGARRTRWPDWSAGRPDTRRRRRTWNRPTCWWTRCGAAHPPGPAIRVNLQHVPVELRPAQEPLGSGRKDLGQLVGRSDLELVVAAVARRLVRPPAEEDGGVAEAVALEVIVLHLADPLDPKRLPGEILPRAPAALPAGHPARPGRLRLGPAAPGMLLQRVGPQRLQLLRQLLPPRHGERRRHPDVLQVPLLVVQSEEQRADRVLARSCASGTPPPRSRRCGRASP